MNFIPVSIGSSMIGTVGLLFSLGFSTLLENPPMAQDVTATLNLPVPGTNGNTEQFCNRYQVSRATWWRWSKGAGFPAPIRLGRAVRWPVDAVHAYLTQQGA